MIDLFVYLLEEYPVPTILALIFILSKIFGGKKRGQNAEKPAQQKLEVKKESNEGNVGRIERAIRDAMDQAKRDLGDGNRPAPPKVAQSARPAAAPAPPAPAQPDPFAFRSLMHRDEMQVDYDVTGKDYDVTAQDYDITAQDYDLTAKDYDVTGEDYDQTVTTFDTRARSSSFTYHSAIEEPADQAYHLKGFKGFHRAGGLTREDRDRSRIASEGGAMQEDPGLITLRDPAELRRAIIMQEILGRPKALRNRP